jgi:hypothetical protein
MALVLRLERELDRDAFEAWLDSELVWETFDPAQRDLDTALGIGRG